MTAAGVGSMPPAPGLPAWGGAPPLRAISEAGRAALAAALGGVGMYGGVGVETCGGVGSDCFGTAEGGGASGCFGTAEGGGDAGCTLGSPDGFVVCFGTAEAGFAAAGFGNADRGTGGGLAATAGVAGGVATGGGAAGGAGGGGGAVGA
ncbi:MAG: hypothetical protein HY908_33310 [Myxococcales bacterium]|nr:hypothetical protein [Myxococcales bacterium]